MLAQSDRFTITDLCEQFGISRKTGCIHLERYAATGLKGCERAVTDRTSFRNAPTKRSRP